MKRIHLLYLLITAVALYFIGNAIFKPNKQGSEKKTMPIAASSIFYKVIDDTTINSSISINGTIQADEAIDIKSEIQGKIIRIGFKEGSSVNAGALLIKINDEELKAQYESLKTKLKQAKAQEYRQRILLQKEAISQEEYESVATTYESLKADASLIKAQLSKTEIKAPFSGKIGLRFVSEGDYVNTTTQIAKLIKDDIIKITFSIPEKYAGMLQKKPTIQFTVGGIDSLFKADVYAIEPQINESTRTLLVRAKAKNNAHLVAGTFAEVALNLKEIKNAILIPNEAVIPILKGKKVFIVKNGLAQEVIIETGIRTAKTIQVTKGLMVGDTLVTSGIMSIKNGSLLKLRQQ